MTREERLAQVLTHVAPLPQATLREVLRGFRPRALRAGERLLTSGEVCTQLAFVCEGVLMSQSNVSKGEVSCDLFAEGDFATDYVSFLTGSPSTVEIVALEPCELLAISGDALRHLYETVPGVERLGRKIAEGRFVAAVERAGSLLTESASERYST
jgi:CRP-like cAMP-binding protein